MLSDPEDNSSQSSVELTPEELETLQDNQAEQIINTFLNYDYEHRDGITHDDFKLAMRDLGDQITLKMQYQMLAEADPKNTGLIDFISFKTVVLKKRSLE